jgi:hypothetical protein
MKILSQIRKKSKIRTQKTSLQPIQKHWVYKLSIEQVSLIFEAHDLSCFGRNKAKKYIQFINEYNELFNSGSGVKEFNTDKLLLRWYTKLLKLNAMYNALTTCEAENSKAEFKNMFNKDFESIDDLNLITAESNRFNDKIEILKPLKPLKSTNDGIPFVKLVRIVEISRSINIDREIKLYEFYGMYKTELEKWNN